MLFELFVYNMNNVFSIFGKMYVILFVFICIIKFNYSYIFVDGKVGFHIFAFSLIGGLFFLTTITNIRTFTKCGYREKNMP